MLASIRVRDVTTTALALLSDQRTVGGFELCVQSGLLRLLLLAHCEGRQRLVDGRRARDLLLLKGCQHLLWHLSRLIHRRGASLQLLHGCHSRARLRLALRFF